MWSRRRANSTFELAWNVHRRLPILGEAMLAGILDEPRAVAFIRWTLGLTDEQAAMVCDQLVPQASSWTVGELGCRTPATRTDQDHILPWAERGLTAAENLHPACRHDHRARHHGGWRVSTAGPHLVVWTSPLGHRYPSPLPKIIILACDAKLRSLPALGPHRDRDYLPEGPAMTLVSDPSPLREAAQPDTGVAAPPEPHGGRHGETREFVWSELEEPPF